LNALNVLIAIVEICPLCDELSHKKINQTTQLLEKSSRFGLLSIFVNQKIKMIYRSINPGATSYSQAVEIVDPKRLVFVMKKMASGDRGYGAA
jgi:hypothetical protein